MPIIVCTTEPACAGAASAMYRTATASGTICIAKKRLAKNPLSAPKRMAAVESVQRAVTLSAGTVLIEGTLPVPALVSHILLHNHYAASVDIRVKYAVSRKDHFPVDHSLPMMDLGVWRVGHYLPKACADEVGALRRRRAGSIHHFFDSNDNILGH